MTEEENIAIKRGLPIFPRLVEGEKSSTKFSELREARSKIVAFWQIAPLNWKTRDPISQVQWL
jgi:hypothetical protein